MGFAKNIFDPGGGEGIFGVPVFGDALGGLLGKPDTENIEDLAKELGRISEAEQGRRLLLQEPLRQQLFGGPEGAGQLNTFLETGEIPLSLQVPFTSYQEAIAGQGQRTREDIVGRVGARGGQLRDLLANQRLSEARQVSEIPLLEQNVRNQLFQQAFGAAVGQEFPIVGGFGTAGNLYGTAAGIDLQFKDQLLSGVGAVAGFAG